VDFPENNANHLQQNHESPLNTINPYMVGGFNPSEKYESQLGLLFSISHILWKIKNVPNHQPAIKPL